MFQKIIIIIISYKMKQRYKIFTTKTFIHSFVHSLINYNISNKCKLYNFKMES
jgi:hypothetical protein